MNRSPVELLLCEIAVDYYRLFECMRLLDIRDLLGPRASLGTNLRQDAGGAGSWKVLF